MSEAKKPKRKSVSQKNVCPVCRINCLYPSVLNDHMNKHTGDRPYHCEICESSFKSQVTYRRHKKQHEPKKPLECDICGSVSSSERYFKIHRAMHTSPKTFRCDVCGSEFNRKSILNEHKKPSQKRCEIQKCLWCDATANTYRCIETHIKKYHAQKEEAAPNVHVEEIETIDVEHPFEYLEERWIEVDDTVEDSQENCSEPSEPLEPQHEEPPSVQVLSDVDNADIQMSPVNREEFFREWFIQEPPEVIAQHDEPTGAVVESQNDDCELLSVPTPLNNPRSQNSQTVESEDSPEILLLESSRQSSEDNSNDSNSLLTPTAQTSTWDDYYDYVFNWDDVFQH